MKIFALLIEPANYTLATIKHIYEPRGVNYAYLFGASEASSIKSDALSDLSFIRRIEYFCEILKSYDAFVINDYTQRIDLEFIFLNLLFFRKPFAIESDTELQIPKNWIKRIIKSLCLRFLFTRKCCYGFPAGRFAHEQLYLHYGMTKDHIVMMPMVTEAKSGLRLSKEPHRPFCFGYVGRLIALKQIDKIIAAIRNIETNVEFEFNIVGDGEERESLEKISEWLPIHFKGALFGDEKDNAIAEMDALILNSTHDQWGYVVNEALTLGVPVIVSNGVGCRHELVEERDGRGATGLVVNKDSVDELSEAMTQMCTDKELWQRFHENALKRMEYWNYDLYAKQFDSWVKKVSQ